MTAKILLKQNPFALCQFLIPEHHRGEKQGAPTRTRNDCTASAQRHAAGFLKDPRTLRWEQPASEGHQDAGSETALSPSSLYITWSKPGKNDLYRRPQNTAASGTCPSSQCSHSSDLWGRQTTRCRDWVPLPSEDLSLRKITGNYIVSPAPQVIRMRVMQGLVPKTFPSRVSGGGCGNSYSEVCVYIKHPVNGRASKSWMLSCVAAQSTVRHY